MAIDDAVEFLEVLMHYPDHAKHHETIRILDPLDWLKSRNHLSPEQAGAADRIVEDYLSSLMGAQMGMDPSRPIVDHSPVFQVPVERLNAAQAVALAMKAIGDIHSMPIREILFKAIPVAQYGKTYTRYSSDRDCTTAALTSLRNALDALARYYG